MEKVIAVGMGGFLGANARYFMGIWIADRFKPTLWGMSYGTLFVNITGSFFLALFYVWLERRLQFPESLRLLIATGFFGAYTTFSTYAVESVDLIREGNFQGGLGTILLTNLFCIIGVFLGIILGARLT